MNVSQINFTHSIKEEIQAHELTLLIDRDSHCVSNSTNPQPTERQKDATLYTDGSDAFLSLYGSGSE
jgi:hypothetical protein